MDDQEQLSPTERISRLLSTVEEDSPRRRALGAALDFKGSWIDLAAELEEIARERLWKDWDYASLDTYCRSELQLGKAEIGKLRDGFAWLSREAPQLLEPPATPAPEGDEEVPPPPPRRPIPDIDTVGQLAKGYREYEQERIPRDTYEELKQAALRGERSPYQLRREFKEAIPEHLREKKPPNPRKHLARALSALEKALAEIEEGDGPVADRDLFEHARRLRDEISSLVTPEGDG
ncbi:MAG: hypothetical protein ACQEXJ_12415 [Myxococcota bacterium]